MKEWVFWDELLAAFHRWPTIVAFALAGTILGLAFAYFWPSSFRANVELSVELNPYRVLDDRYIPEFAGAEFRNIDDYKHWQMLQLSILVLSDPYMQESLNRLREQDPYWSSIDEKDLRAMLDANWRNAGLWLLVADGGTSERAVEAVETWRDVILELTNESLTSSRELFKLELTLRSLNDELVENQLKLVVLQDFHSDLNNLLNELNRAQGVGTADENDRLEIIALAHQLESLFPDGQSILEEFPNENAPLGEYLAWIERVNLLIENEMDSIRSAKTFLEDEILQVTSTWEMGLAKAQGLSATLALENLQNAQPKVKQLRSYSLAALVGTLIGLLLWILIFLIRVTRKGYL